MDKEQKRQHRLEQKNKWMPHYELKYGVQPTEFKPATSADELPVVTKAKCRFCECFGREHAVEAAQLNVADLNSLNSAAAVAAMQAAGMGTGGIPGSVAGTIGANGAIMVPGASGTTMILKKRKKRQTLKIFGPNFRTDNLESHLSREHPAKWKEYDKLREKDKANFFPETNFMLRDPSVALQLAGGAVTPPPGTTSGLTSPAMKAQQQQQQQHVATTQAEFAAAVAGVSPVAPMVPPNGHHGNGNAAAAAAAIVANVGSAGNLGVMGAAPTLVMPFKFVLSAELMEVVEQLLGNRVGVKSASDTNGSSSTSATSSSAQWWQQFVRIEETLRQVTAASSASPTVSLASPASSGDIKLMNNMYTVSIANEPLFLYVTEMLKAGISFDSSVWMVNATKRILPHSMRVFGGNAEYTSNDIVSVVQRLTCANLSCISQLMNSAWTFALHLQFVTLYSSGFVNVSIQIAVNDAIHHLHLISVPLEAQKHSVSTLCALLIKLLGCLDSRGLEKVIGLVLDGDPYHCARFKSIGALFRQEIEKKTKESTFYVLTSGVYQLNELMNDLLQNFETEFGFLTSLMEIKNFCLNRPALMEQMGISCNASNASGASASSVAAAAASLGGSSYTAPFGILSGACNVPASTSVPGVPGTTPLGSPSSTSSASSSILNGGTVHWVQVFETCEWLALHRELILKCYEEYEKSVASNPNIDLGVQSSIASNRWWILNFVLKDFMKDVYSAFAKCELGASSVADVQRHLRELVFHLRIKYNLKMTSPAEAAATTAASASTGANENDDGNTTEPTSLDVKMVDDQIAGADPTSLGPSSPTTGTGNPEEEDDDASQHGFSYQDFVNAVIPLDLFMYETFQLENIKEIDEKERVAIYQQLKTNVFSFVAKLCERLDASLPPSTPFEFVVMNNLSFMEFLNQHQARLRAKYTGKILAMITEDRNRMLGEFAQKGVFYEQTNGIAKRNMPFEASWQPSSVEYSSLFQLALGFGSLLSVRKRLWMFLPNQQQQLQWMEDKCSEMSNLRLEAFFQSHQFDLLVNLRRFVDAYV